LLYPVLSEPHQYPVSMPFENASPPWIRRRLTRGSLSYPSRRRPCGLLRDKAGHTSCVYFSKQASIELRQASARHLRSRSPCRFAKPLTLWD